MSQCEFRKQNGERCRAHALRGRSLCISHDPKAAAMKKAAVVKGGQNRRVPVRVVATGGPVQIQTIEDVQAVSFQAIQALCNGTIPVDTARTLGYLASVACRIFETVELARRVEALEDQVDRVGTELKWAE